MKPVHAILTVLMLLAAFPGFPDEEKESAERFVKLALSCVHAEYPNKIAHVLQSDEDVAPPRVLTPAFYGCFDWHSSVHGHWLLSRVARRHPDLEVAPIAVEALKKSLTAENLKAERAYLLGEGRASFERPYGLAWLLQLATELREWDDEGAREMATRFLPVEDAAIARINDWLPKLAYPIRTGEHSQTAFAFGLFLDYATVAENAELEDLVIETASRLYLTDVNCPLSYEPSGQDFLSPCLAEADLVRRILEPVDFAAWLGAFLPTIPRDGSAKWLPVGKVTDRSDGKLAHLDGLNLSRAWMLEGIASGLPEKDPRRASLIATAGTHSEASLPFVTNEYYEGGHWLGSFATYLVTQRGY